MQRFGFIRSEIELKTLILYVLRRADLPVNFETLTDMSLCDGAIDYFEFANCVASLVETGHIIKYVDREEVYSISKKGIENLEICEGSLAAPIRQQVDESVGKLAAKLRREEYIEAKLIQKENDTYAVSCRLRDDSGEILSLEMSVLSKEQARLLQSNFKNNAEKIYNVILRAMVEEPQN